MVNGITPGNFNNDYDNDLEQLQAKQAEEKRLLSLYIQHIKKTGESNYPALVSLVEDFFEVENSSEGLLTQYQIQQFSKRLDDNMKSIKSAVSKINLNLEELKNCLKNDKNSSSREQGISEQLQEGLGQINHCSKDITKLVKRYLEVDQYSEKDKSEEAKNAMKLKEDFQDIRYFCEFLNKHLQVEMIKQDYADSIKEPIYMRRIYKYQDLLLEKASSLKQIIIFILESKRTGGKFSSKDSG